MVTAIARLQSPTNNFAKERDDPHQVPDLRCPQWEKINSGTADTGIKLPVY
jgi:hypothetical protein